MSAVMCSIRDTQAPAPEFDPSAPRRPANPRVPLESGYRGAAKTALRLKASDLSEYVRARFWAKVDTSDASECWMWTARRDKTGYGRFSLKIEDRWRSAAAHRVAYTIRFGSVPDGRVLDHLCRNRACVNPDHLEPVTDRENLRRGATKTAENATKTHCPKGHPYDAENTRFVVATNRQRSGRTIMRRCAICAAATLRKHRDRTRPGTHPCPFCGRRFAGRRGVGNHVTLLHPERRDEYRRLRAARAAA